MIKTDTWLHDQTSLLNRSSPRYHCYLSSQYQCCYLVLLQAWLYLKTIIISDHTYFSRQLKEISLKKEFYKNIHSDYLLSGILSSANDPHSSTTACRKTKCILIQTRNCFKRLYSSTLEFVLPDPDILGRALANSLPSKQPTYPLDKLHTQHRRRIRDHRSCSPILRGDTDPDDARFHHISLPSTTPVRNQTQMPHNRE